MSVNYRAFRFIVLLCLASFLAGYLTEASAEEDIKFCCNVQGECYPVKTYKLCKVGYFE